MRVIPLAYAEPRRRPARPTSLVVIGLFSILIGLVSGLVNAAGMWYIVKNYAASVPPPPPLPRPPLAAANVSPHMGDFVRADGLKRADRQRVLDAVAMSVSLSADRAILLDRFLTDIGQKAFGPAPYHSAGDVATQINKITRRPDGPDGAGDFATHCIATTRGTIMLDNVSATFRPANVALGGPVTLNGTIITNEKGMRWSAAAIDDWIEHLQTRRSNDPVITAQQAAVLVEHLATIPAATSSRRDSDFYFPRIPDDLLGIHSVGNNGIIAGRLGQGAFFLPDGRTASDAQVPYGFGPGPAFQPLAERPGTRFVPALPGDLNAIRASLVVDAISLILAMLLIVAGIRTLAESRGAAGMHVAWAVAKIAISLLSLAVGIWWTLSMPVVRGAANNTPVWIWQTIGIVIFSLVYPGVVLGVMSSRAVREHYLTLGQPMWLFSPQRRAAWRLEAAEILSSAIGRLVLGACVMLGALAALGHLFAGVYALLGAGGSGGTLIVHVGALVIGGIVAGLGYLIPAWARKNCFVTKAAAQGEGA